MGPRGRIAGAALVAAVLALTTACGDDGGNGGDGGEDGAPLQFWTTLIEPDRQEVQRQLMERFTEETGIEAEFVPIAEDELDSLMVSGAASGELPDVVYHPDRLRLRVG